MRPSRTGHRDTETQRRLVRTDIPLRTAGRGEAAPMRGPGAEDPFDEIVVAVS
jgi:hypothetical protein